MSDKNKRAASSPEVRLTAPVPEVSYGDLSRLLDLALVLHECSASLLRFLQAMIPSEGASEADRSGA